MLRFKLHMTTNSYVVSFCQLQAAHIRQCSDVLTSYIVFFLISIYIDNDPGTRSAKTGQQELQTRSLTAQLC